MIHRDILAPQITLPAHMSFAGQSFGRPMQVDMEAFFEFSFWIAEELLDLESQFQMKAPVALDPPKRTLGTDGVHAKKRQSPEPR